MQTTLEEKLQVNFKDKNLLKRAVTHASKSPNNYERLEFLGDSILDFLVGDYLFKNSDKDEGFLTVMRSHYVAESYLCQVFDRLNLSNEIIKGKSMNGNLPKAVKADVIEAIIAAIYLDSSLDEAKRFIERNFELDKFDLVKDTNYKSKLQELVQAGFKCAMKYDTFKTETGFKSNFYMDEDLVATGEGLDKTSAEQDCAKKAIAILFKDEI